MNGINYIREKSNLSKNALAERIGVTRQTVTLWEKGVRRPSPDHLQWLCEFYGLPEKWFGEIDSLEKNELDRKMMYAHDIGEKEFYTFIPNGTGPEQKLGIPCGELESMLGSRFVEASKRGSEVLDRVEHYVHPNNSPYLCDMIQNAERGIAEIDRYLNLMDRVQTKKRHLKVAMRYEIKTILYAMMVALGECSFNEVVESNQEDFKIEGDTIHVEKEYMNELVGLMREHWDNAVEHQERKKQYRGH